MVCCAPRMTICPNVVEPPTFTSQVAMSMPRWKLVSMVAVNGIARSAWWLKFAMVGQGAGPCSNQ